jgi:V-type H+-transporting ATPase subunit d
MFDSIATLAVASNMRELYRLVLVDTPLAPYFSETISSEDLDEMNVEIMRNVLYKAYLADFLKFCEQMGGATGNLMREILHFEADRRAVNITINSLDTELSRDDRRRLFSDFGALYPVGHADLVACDDFEQVKAVMDNTPGLYAVTSKIQPGNNDTLLEKHFYQHEQKLCAATFLEQFNYAVFYAILRMREQEIRNIMWIAECVAQDCRNRVTDGLVSVGLENL